MATKRSVSQAREQLDLCEQRTEIALARAATAEQRASIEAFRAFYKRKKTALIQAHTTIRPFTNRSN